MELGNVWVLQLYEVVEDLSDFVLQLDQCDDDDDGDDNDQLMLIPTSDSSVHVIIINYYKISQAND